MIPFHRIANATPRAFFRYWRRASFVVKMQRLNAAAERSFRLREEKEASRLKEVDINRLREYIRQESMERERLREMVDTLLCNGFEFTARRFSDTGQRCYSLMNTRMIEVAHFSSTPAVIELRKTIIELQRRRHAYPLHLSDVYRMERDERLLRQFSESIARTLARKIYEEMTAEEHHKTCKTEFHK